MTAPTFSVGRLSATVHGDVDDVDTKRVDRMLRRLADRRLEEALRQVTLPPGRWCVRRLDVSLRFDSARPESAIEAEWARLLIASVWRALAERTHDVVYYRDDRAAVADLVASVATGQLRHAWAWAKLGLLAEDPREAPGAAILAAVSRQPEYALTAVLTAAGRVGLAALDRALGAGGWSSLALLCRAHVVGSNPPPPLTNLGTLGTPHDGGRDSESPIRVLASTLVRSSSFAVHIGQSRLRADPARLGAWAVLAVAETDPSALRRSPSEPIVRAVAQLIAPSVGVAATPPTQPSLGTSGEPELRPGVVPPVSAGADPVSGSGPRDSASEAAEIRGAVERLGSVAERDDRVERHEDGAAPQMETSHGSPSAPQSAPAHMLESGLPEMADADPIWPTEWAGLLFLLATASDAGIPDVVLDDPIFAGRSLRWVVHAIGRTLVPAADDDPALLALAGLDPTRRSPSVQETAASPLERERIAALGERWAVVTAERLGQTTGAAAADVVAAVAGRRGHVVAQPGWIEVHLSLAEVDLAVRRAGLDLDPGWVPWLGAVVRFRYV